MDLLVSATVVVHLYEQAVISEYAWPKNSSLPCHCAHVLHMVSTVRLKIIRYPMICHCCWTIF